MFLELDYVITSYFNRYDIKQNREINLPKNVLSMVSVTIIIEVHDGNGVLWKNRGVANSGVFVSEETNITWVKLWLDQMNSMYSDETKNSSKPN